jgi:hypothetical protein
MLLRGLGSVLNAPWTAAFTRRCTSSSLNISSGFFMPTPTPDDFFTWLGKCITSWAQVEDHLFEICAFSLGSTKERTAVVYYRTPTIDSRLSLTDELIRTVLPRKESGEHDHADVIIWNNIRKEIIAALPARNRMAHHPVTYRVVGPVTGSLAAQDLLTFSWYESAVSDAERLRGRHEDAKPLTAPDLSYHRVDVETLITKLNLFRTHVLAKYAK